MFIFRKNHPLIKIINFSLIDLICPPNLNIHWNYGSLLSLILIIQIFTGFLLALRFPSSSLLSFDTLINICQDRNYGWLLRLLHSTGASFFFLFIYLHIGRGIYYGCFDKKEVWNLGVLIYLLLIGTAFLGYVLPWGQISYWAATVITNLITAIPLIGNLIVQWVWGGFAVGNPTITRFFALHYLLPFIVRFLVILHLYFLHLTGSSNPLGISSKIYKVSFHPYYSIKDIFYYVLFLFLFFIVTLIYGYNLIDSENFIPANALVTPIHIQPEWYFLFAYAILRSIPNKIGGVIALLLSVILLFMFPITSHPYTPVFHWLPWFRFIFWSFVSCFLLLTWLGRCPAEIPYINVSIVITILYFILIIILIFINKITILKI